MRVVGDKDVTLNLAQAEIEVAVGGRRHGVFVSGGNSTPSCARATAMVCCWAALRTMR